MGTRTPFGMGESAQTGSPGPKSSRPSRDAEASCQKLIEAKVGKGYKKAATKKVAKKKASPKKKQTRKKSRLAPEVQAAFEAQIEKHELTEYRSELLRSARPKLVIDVGAPLKRIPKGISRIGGPPDVRSKDDWQLEDGQYLVFYFQLSLAEIGNAADFDLPKSGLLSLYVDNQNMVNDWYGNSRIIHNTRTDNLNQYPLPKLAEYCDGDLREGHLPTCARPPRRLTIREAVWLPYDPDWLSRREREHAADIPASAIATAALPICVARRLSITIHVNGSASSSYTVATSLSSATLATSTSSCARNEKGWTSQR